MSFLPLTLTAAGHFNYSRPYLEVTMGFLVPDYRRREFAEREALVARTGLRVAVTNDRYFLGRVRRLLPNAELLPIDDPVALVTDGLGDADALIVAAEVASAWSLLHPSFAVVVPRPALQGIPLGYPLPLGARELKSAVDTWIELKKSDGTIRQLYDHWILGRRAREPRPRWSVIRDVLHWAD
jgi:ABC-type amino acid transport substrate-binding protein